ncbi:MAG: Gfo/Idh/MocA family oxidoreductase, partial [Candidatus Bathyarchaeota archaeon]
MGIVGLGGQGRKHFSNCLRMKNLQVSGVADNSKRALARVKRLGINSYENYHEMITKEKPDAVIISLPHDLHEDCVALSSENGC